MVMLLMLLVNVVDDVAGEWAMLLTIELDVPQPTVLAIGISELPLSAFRMVVTLARSARLLDKDEIHAMQTY
jgi:hypothetical protein